MFITTHVYCTMGENTAFSFKVLFSRPKNTANLFARLASLPRTSHQQLLDTSTTAATSYTCYFTRFLNNPREALHIRVITSASAQHRIIQSHRPLHVTPDYSQPVRNIESFKFFLELLKERITTVLFRTKPVLLRAYQGRINQQTFPGLPHREP